jgi:hypothetical protein
VAARVKCLKGLDATSAALGGHGAGAQLSVRAAAVCRDLSHLSLPDRLAASVAAGGERGDLALGGERGELRELAFEEAAAFQREGLPERGALLAAVAGHAPRARCGRGAARCVHRARQGGEPVGATRAGRRLIQLCPPAHRPVGEEAEKQEEQMRRGPDRRNGVGHHVASYHPRLADGGRRAPRCRPRRSGGRTAREQGERSARRCATQLQRRPPNGSRRGSMQELEAFRRPNAHVPGGRRCGAG